MKGEYDWIIKSYKVCCMKFFIVVVICVLNLFMISCSNKGTPSKFMETSINTEVAGMDEPNTKQNESVAPTSNEELKSTVIPTKTEETKKKTEEPKKNTEEATKIEEQSNTAASILNGQPSKTLNHATTPVPTLSPENLDPTAEISYEIPEKYSSIRSDYCGTINQIYYDTYDYFGDNAPIKKPAYVYLPYGYDETCEYDVLYLMHGIGGNEKEWGMYHNASTIKAIMDNLIYYGDIKPFIVVVPNGRSSVNYANTSSDFNSFYEFGKELRNDLIPYIDANFATFAEFNEQGYDLTKARQHRAMGGLSMGAMQTINIGLCESLDVISYFGAFSACPTTNTSAKIVSALDNFKDYEVNYFYNICGTADGIAWPHATNAVLNITSLSERLSEDENFKWQEIEGGAHDFKVWYLGFYNYVQLIFNR